MIAFLGCAAALLVLTPATLVLWLSAYAREREREGWRR